MVAPCWGFCLPEPIGPGPPEPPLFFLPYQEPSTTVGTASSTEITPIPGTEGGWNVVYSPDGQRIAYAVGTELFKRPIVGGSPVRLAEDAAQGKLGLAWLDDGTILYEQQPLNPEPGFRRRRLVQIPEDGGETLVVFRREPGEGTPTWVHGLPDARGALVATCILTACPDAELHVVDLRDLSSELLLEQVNKAWYAPTGHLVYVRVDGALFAAPFDLDALEITGSAISLFDGVRLGEGMADMQLAAGGTLLYVERSSSAVSVSQQLLVVDLDGNEEALGLTPRDIFTVGWSPDGRSVAYSSDRQIYTYNVELGTTPRQLTFEGNNSRPRFSPDGSRVAFRSIREGTLRGDLFVKSLDDDAPPRSIITLPVNQNPIQWPSDTLIVFERSNQGSADLWMLDLSDPDSARAEVYLPSEAELRDIRVSRGGTLAAYMSNETGLSEVYIRSFPDPGAPTLVSQGGGESPFWSPDDNTVYYWGIGGVTPTFMAARIQRNPTPVVLSRDSLFTGDDVRLQSDLHPEGDRLVVVRNVGSTADSEGAAPEPERLIMVTNFFELLRQQIGN